jgi:hypothetical protein
MGRREHFRQTAVLPARRAWRGAPFAEGSLYMHGIIYLVGLVVIVLAVLSLLGLR